MTAPATMPSSLLERTRALAPQLRESAAATEQARRVLPDTFDALSRAGVFRMTAPKKWGGDEADFQTQCDVLAEVARACPSSSWVATIFSAMSWLAATYPEQAQEEIFAGGDPRISGVFSPTGTAVRKDGGFVVNGKWGFNTGGQGSNWTVLNTILAEGDGLPVCVIARTTDLDRLDDWNASGMAGTGSHTVVAKDVFIPGHRAVPLPDLVEGKGAANRHTAPNPYFNLPLAPVLIVNGGGTPLGTARGAYDTFMERLPGRPIAYTYYTNRAEAAVTHLQVGEASLLIDSSDAHVRRACALLDGPGATSLSVLDRVRSRAHITYATGLARQAVDILFNASGASSIQPHIPIQRFQRDIQALANHAVMHTQTGTELYGRVLCGLEPNTPLY
ncbi:MAG TPA: acyl-CoA dehydrogenase family protein [Vicinamibacterales bacterium]|nr:acyl-CoA dehydrogenase family protein [Vicinamibacterales bacterium]